MPTLTYLSGAPRVSTRPAAETGGPRAHVLGILNAFESVGWDTRTYIAGDTLPSWISGKGSEASLHQNRSRATVADILRIGLNVASQVAVRRLVSETDLAYERYGAYQCLGKVFAKSRVPWIVETQRMALPTDYGEPQTTTATGRLLRSEVNTYRACDGIVCSTESVKQDLMRFARIPAEKILVLPNAVDTDQYDPVNYRPARRFKEFTVGFAGRLYPWQGLELLIRATHLLLASKRIPIRVQIIGDGIQRPVLERLVSDLGLESMVYFTGHVPGPRVPELLLGCDVSYVGHQRATRGVLPFSPIKLYESMSLGLPVIAPAEPEFSDLIVPGENGLLFAPKDPRGLARVLDQAAELGPALRTMGARGRANVVQDHSWQQRVLRLLQWIEHERGLLEA